MGQAETSKQKQTRLLAKVNDFRTQKRIEYLETTNLLLQEAVDIIKPSKDTDDQAGGGNV